MSLENTRALAEMLGLVPINQAEPEPEPEPTTAPDFDGGVREPAPGPSDPEAEHNQLIAELLRNLPTGAGGAW